MTVPPGWYVAGDDRQKRWWDGASWSDPADDSRVRPGLPTVSGSEILEFVPDQAWPAAPKDWYPFLMWEPHSAWPLPDGALWRATSKVNAHVEESLDHLSAMVTILEQEQESGAWRLEDFSDVPLVWTTPPGWPTYPRGWSPPQGWKPPRGTPRAPTGWQFWQEDPTVVKCVGGAPRLVGFGA